MAALAHSQSLPPVRPAPKPAAAPATAPTGASISGMVLGEKTYALQDVEVTALHLPTGIRHSTTTDGEGAFTLNNLLAGGPYALQLSRAGFRPQLINNLFLAADKPLQLDLMLQVATVAVGTRRADRTSTGSVVPVDVVDMRDLALTAPRTDITQLLTYVVPSFNSNRETSTDGADHVDASSLRGLNPDQTLVLVNGHRRHTSAFVNLLGSRGVGSATPDLNTLPANALDQVEVLRDGAAAQYGSDAIAGVMNFNLKSDNHGGNVLINNGIHSSGYGFNTTVSVNKGLKLGSKGFLNLTGEADYRGRTTTAGYDRDLASWPVYSSTRAQEDSFLLANHKTYKDYRQINGDAQIINYRAVVNAGLPLSGNARLYAFGTYNFRQGHAVAPWVLPGANPADLLDRDGYRLGYQPDINTRIHDGAGVLGLDLKLGQWNLDLSQSIGTNKMRYDLDNTINPTLGLNSPTSFEAGGVQFTQAVSNATISRLFDKILAGTNVAFGGEFRNDYYEIAAGEPDSYRDGGLGQVLMGNDTIRSTPGSQGFIGYDPVSATSGSRQNYAGFLDVEADVVKNWTVGGAVRYENYSDANSAFVYKATTRVQLGKMLAVRGAYNTGFRAASQQQRLYRQLSLLPTTTGTTYSAIINNDSPVAASAGISKLSPERSRNISAGIVLTPTAGLVLTADAYQIDIDDRITLTNVFDVTTVPEIQQALAAQSQADISTVQFFANAINTRTRGLDLVGGYSHALGKGTLRLTAAANFNETEQVGALKVPAAFANRDNPTVGNAYIGQRELSLVTTGSPRSKVFASLGYEGNKLGGTVRYTRFGEVGFYDFNFDGFDEGAYFLRFSPKSVTDIILTYKAGSKILLSLGAQNIFNVLPDDVIQAAKNGFAPGGLTFEQYEAAFPGLHGGIPSYLPSDRDILPYQAVQMGARGSFFYLKASYALGL